MRNREERCLNVMIKNDDDKNDVIISFSTILKNLKKFLAVWVVLAILFFIMACTFTAISARDKYQTLSALVSFTYDGIEKGNDPKGNTFDVNTIKNPTVIQNALTKLNLPNDDVEKIRENISIEGIVPKDAIDKITTYKSVYGASQSNALQAAQAMLDVKYYPTQFKIYFNYAGTGFSNSKAVQLFNTILSCYHDYFFKTYGYNEALGSAVTALNYKDYDYAEAVDVFDTTLDTLKGYVSKLSTDDTTRFRSSVTGFTFSDLKEAIDALKSMDLDIISSYITVNNVTKDKDSLISYYQYRIDALTRQKAVAQDNLNAINDSIKNYQKDTVMIFGNGTDNTDTKYTQASEEYDNLIKQKNDMQNTLSTNTQQINFYNQRIAALSGKPASDDAKVKRVEDDLAKLNTKVNKLLNDVNKTSDEYYENVYLADAYNILVPASSSKINVISAIISEAKLPIIVLEGLLLIVYIAVVFVRSMTSGKNEKLAVNESDEDEKNDSVNEKQDNSEDAEKKNKK